MDVGIRGKVAVVTGGDSGMGLKSAEFLLREGVKVALTDIDPARRVGNLDRNQVAIARLREMKAGSLADGAATLRARIDMASPNINMRDPALYRIKRATHHATGDAETVEPDDSSRTLEPPARVTPIGPE